MHLQKPLRFSTKNSKEEKGTNTYTSHPTTYTPSQCSSSSLVSPITLPTQTTVLD